MQDINVTMLKIVWAIIAEYFCYGMERCIVWK